MQKECGLQYMHLESTVNRYCTIVGTLMWLVSWYPVCLPWTKCQCLKWLWNLCLGFWGWGSIFVLGVLSRVWLSFRLGIMWIGPAVSNATQNNLIRYFSLINLEMAENLSGNRFLKHRKQLKTKWKFCWPCTLGVVFYTYPYMYHVEMKLVLEK